MQVYLDNAATTPLTQEVKSYIIELLDTYANPSSLYSSGLYSRQVIEHARSNVARFINGKSDNIIFTSGGSASNILAIRGYIQRNKCTVLYSPIAHKSIIKCVESIKNAYPRKVNKYGEIDLGDQVVEKENNDVTEEVVEEKVFRKSKNKRAKLDVEE